MFRLYRTLGTAGFIFLFIGTRLHYKRSSKGGLMPAFSLDRFEALRRAGKSYSQIAEILGVSRNTLKSYARRNPTDEAKARTVCAFCGTKMISRGKQRFCSDSCRYAWNYSHRILDATNAIQKVCPHCGRSFFSYPSSNKMYCCRDCYLAGRYGRRM